MGKAVLCQRWHRQHQSATGQADYTATQTFHAGTGGDFKLDAGLVGNRRLWLPNWVDVAMTTTMASADLCNKAWDFVLLPDKAALLKEAQDLAGTGLLLWKGRGTVPPEPAQ
eukprot:2734513-Amphidinium_carterae.1